MRKRAILSALITVALLTMSLVGFAQQPKVYYYKIDDNISKPALRLTEKAVKEAEAGKFDYIPLLFPCENKLLQRCNHLKSCFNDFVHIIIFVLAKTSPK